MASSRTTHQDRSGGDGATAPGDTFVWVSLRDPSAEELASVQREFGLPGRWSSTWARWPNGRPWRWSANCCSR